MKIAILGYGDQGRSAYEYWRDGNDITVCDRNEQLQIPAGVQAKLGPTHLHHLDGFDLLVRSPIVHPRDIVAANSPAILEKVTTNTNEFLRACPTRNIIGVTGTKGKGTTSTLLTEMLKADGKQVYLGGNIGTPPLDLLHNGITADDWVVLELANFQLIDLKYSPHIAVCLMVVPEHLDWHPDTDEYYTAKSQLFRHQTADDFAIYNADNDNSKRIASTGKAWRVPYMSRPGAYVVDGQVMIDDQSVCRTNELKLLGTHNWQNACAALTAFWKVSQNLEAAHQVLTSFSGLPFRIEYRGEKHGIRFYNDSFASQPSATVAAIESIPEPKVMIIGGYERGLDLSELAEKLQQSATHVRQVLLVGASADRIAASLDTAGYTHYQHCRSKYMTDIVQAAVALASPGDAVVLSPGFASFDMFKNFEDRGRQFNTAVETL